jgi:hypothetical protein
MDAMGETARRLGRCVGASVVSALMVTSLGSVASSVASASTSGAVRHAPEELTRRAGRPCPTRMAMVGKSCVDRYDGTESAFSPYEPPRDHRVRAVSRPDVVPQAHASMVDADDACHASGKRLCRAAEWKAACKGPAGTRYPYGDARVAGACVDTNRTSPMTVLYGGKWSMRAMNDPRANQQPNTVEKAGAAGACTNAYGVHDMVGNVHEWTDDGSFRGGYYLDTKLNGEGCDYRTTAHAPTYYDYSTGFRCCADVGELSVDDD